MQRIELNHRQINACTFALLDPLRGDPERLAAWADFPQRSLAPEDFAAQTAQLPRLIELDGLSDALRDRLLGLVLEPASAAGDASCVALLKTDASTERMTVHFRRLVAPGFPQSRRGVFRFHDPAVLEHLTWMLDSKTLASLLGPIDAWLLPLHDAWHAYTPPAGDPALRGFPFHLNPADWQRVFRIGAIHAVLDGDPEWRMAPEKWGPKAETLLIRAERHRLTDRDDAVAFAAHGLRWHRDFDRHPRVAALLNDCAGHPCRYRRLAGRWSEASWQAVVDDLEGRSRVGRPVSAAAVSL